MVEIDPSISELSVIPPQDSVVIHKLFDCRPSALRIEPIAGGETNKNYKVSHDGQLYVARIPYEGNAIVNREVEYRNLQRLLDNPTAASVVPDYEMYIYSGQNKMGSTPRDLSFAPHGTAVTRYIEGRDITTALLRNREVQESLVETLRMFHSSDVRFVNVHDPFENEIAEYREIVCNSKDLPILADADTVSRVDEITRQLEVRLPPDEPISTHNDLVVGNLRMAEDGTIILLDWEYAGFNIRGLHYDFGTLLGENVFLDDPLDEEVFGEILEEASGVYGITLDPKKVHDAAIVNMIVTFWWGGAKYVQASGEKEKQDFAKYVKDRREKLLALII